MPSKKIETPAGTMFVDADFDESSIDPFSMVDTPGDKVDIDESGFFGFGGEGPYREQELDTITINGETFKGKIKRYSVWLDKKTNERVVKVVLIA